MEILQMRMRNACALDLNYVLSGSLGTWQSFYPFFDMSVTVVRTAVTCLVPTPK